MSTTLLDHKQIIMTIENLKINDLTDDPSPASLGPNDNFEVSVDILFKPIDDNVLKTILNNSFIECRFALESMGDGNEIVVPVTLETQYPKSKYTVKTKAQSPSDLKLTNNRIYIPAVSVSLQQEIPKNKFIILMRGFKTGIDGGEFLVEE